MRGPTYTEDQLHTLRDSPLVKKPEGLPSILQWMDVPSDQNNTHTNNNGTARRARVVREGEGGATAEQRPLINPMGQFGRRQSMQPGDETVLGPPKLSFLSARKNATEAKERTGITSTDGDNPGDRFAREKTERWSRDRDPDRARGKDYTNGRRGAREDGEGWTNVKGRKSLGQEDFERFQRPSDRNREKVEGDPENEAAQRRGARERAEPRWGRREDGKEEGPKAGVQGGWREREREPNRDREWNRGGVKVEDDPEWMDTKVEKKESKPRTQEDFQRWKEQMRAKDTPAEEKDESRVIPDDISTAMYSTVPPMLTQPVHTPSIEPTQGILFGNWGREKATDISATEAISSKPKPDKKSKFMNMFAKKDESGALSQPAAPIPTPPAPVFEGNADKEGFQRILQMLGQVPAADQPATQPSAPAPMNGLRHGGGISLDLQQSPPPPPQNNKPAPRTMEQQSILQNILAQRPAAPESRPSQQARFSSMSPDDSLSEQFRLARLEPSYSDDHFSHQQPSSRNAVPEVNLATLLNGRAQNDSHRDQETKQRQTDFLLTLMQQPSRATPPQQTSQNMPRQNQENQHALFFEQHRQQPQMQAKGRPGLPPGFMEDPRMFAENDMMRREAERREQQREQQELRQQLNMQQQQEAIRIKNARMPMGFAGQQDDLMMGLQRRPTANDSRPMTNMGIPSQPIPDMSFMGGRGQPGMPPTPQDRTNNIPPPPGFGGPPMRQPPPGLNGPNSQQQQQMGPSFSAGNTPVGLPPGFAPPGGNMRGGMGFPGGNGMQGLPPQGYFPPAMGYGGPPMGGMREQDPRMMFDGNGNGNGGFGGAGLGSRQGQQHTPSRNGGGGMYQ